MLLTQFGIVKKALTGLLLVSAFFLNAQLHGGFGNAGYSIFENRSYTNAQAIEAGPNGGFYAVFESFDYIDGQFDYETTIVAYTASGERDEHFGLAGQLVFKLDTFTNEKVSQLIATADGLFVLGTVLYDQQGAANKTFVAKLTTTGHVDTTFGHQGYVILHSSIGFANKGLKLIFDEHDDIYIAGYAIDPFELYDPFAAVFKLKANGDVDSSFNNIGSYVYRSLQPDEHTNGKVAHEAGGTFYTINIDHEGYLILAGYITNQFSEVNVISRMSATGVLDTNFFGKGYYFPDLDGYALNGIEQSVQLHDGTIVYALSEIEEPYNLRYATFDGLSFQVNENDINGQQDFLVDITTDGQTVYGVSNSHYAEGFNPLMFPDLNHVTGLLTTDESKSTVSTEMVLDEAYDVDVQHCAYQADSDALLVAGRMLDGDSYFAFVTVLSAVEVGLEPTNSSHEHTILTVLPTVIDQTVEVFFNGDVYDGEFIVMDLRGNVVAHSKNELLRLASGSYLLKSTEGYTSRFFVP